MSRSALLTTVIISFLLSSSADAEIVLLKSGEKLKGEIVITYNKGLLFREREGATGHYYQYDEVNRICTEDGKLYYLMPHSFKKEKGGKGFFPFSRVILPVKRRYVPLPYITPPGGEAIEVRCEGAIDPVTLILKGGVKLKLLGLEPPPSEAGRGIYLGALENLSKRVKGKNVLLYPGPQDPDDKESAAAYVLAEHVFLNADLLEKGLAGSSSMPENHPYRRAFKSLEAYAKNLKYGLWSELAD